MTLPLFPPFITPSFTFIQYIHKMAATTSLDHLSNRMKLEWHSKLNTEMVPAKNFRRTSIIGTIGMSCSQPPDRFEFCPFPTKWHMAVQ